MIHLIDDYYALVMPIDGFTLKRDTGRTDKDGNTVYEVLGYYGTLESTITTGLFAELQKRALINKDVELKEAVEKIREINRSLEEVLREHQN